jgi:hypothetical protein
MHRKGGSCCRASAPSARSRHTRWASALRLLRQKGGSCCVIIHCAMSKPKLIAAIGSTPCGSLHSTQACRALRRSLVSVCRHQKVMACTGLCHVIVCTERRPDHPMCCLLSRRPPRLPHPPRGRALRGSSLTLHPRGPCWSTQSQVRLGWLWCRCMPLAAVWLLEAGYGGRTELDSQHSIGHCLSGRA